MDFVKHQQSLRTNLSELDGFLRSLETADFDSQGLHERLGPMTMEQMIEDYLVGHLEEHAEQLENISLGQ